MNDSKFIEGIYSYCDRWCERCTFCSRCLNYEMQKEDSNNGKNTDLENIEFWESIHKSFKKTIKLLKEIAQKEGIDLSVQQIKDIKKVRKLVRQNVKDHPCAKMAMAYLKEAEKWFGSSKCLFRQKENERDLKIDLGIDVECIGAEHVALYQMIEVIIWYKTFIYVKISRALHQQMIGEHYSSDADGSAKIALIGIDRSIAAWGELIKLFDDSFDEILDILVLLEKLRKSVQNAFPDARNFIRPGFDETTENKCVY